MNQCGKTTSRGTHESAFVRDNEGRTKIHFSLLRSRNLARSTEARCPQSSLQLFNPRRQEKKRERDPRISFSPSTYRKYIKFNDVHIIHVKQFRFIFHCYQIVRFDKNRKRFRSSFFFLLFFELFLFCYFWRAHQIVLSRALISFWCRNFPWRECPECPLERKLMYPAFVHSVIVWEIRSSSFIPITSGFIHHISGIVYFSFGYKVVTVLKKLWRRCRNLESTSAQHWQ